MATHPGHPGLQPGKDPFSQLGPGERRLFISLWIILILSFAIWHFYPNFEPREPASPIQVEMGAELHGRFEQVELTKTSPSQNWLRIQFAQGYLRTLPPDGHEILLAYDLLNDVKVVYTGAIRFELSRNDDTAQVMLPNPERVYTRRIRIYLPQR